MKKTMIFLFAILLLGCSAEKEAPTKLTTSQLNQVPYEQQLFFTDKDFDVVSISYLAKHKEDYLNQIGGDAFVFVNGNIFDLDITDFSTEDLSYLDETGQELLSTIIGYDIYLDDGEEYLSYNHDVYDDPLSLKTGGEYLFLVSVSDISNSVLEIYEID